MHLFSAGRRGLSLGLGAALLTPALLRAQTPLRVRYARPPREVDEDQWFALRLLRRVLQASEEPHRIEPSQHVVLQERAVRDLATDFDTVDLIWTVTNAERERAMRPVRVPIDRGLYGWRLMLVRRGEAGRLAGVRSLGDLRRFELLQGEEWPDTQILRANEMRVRASASTRGLFDLLGRGQGDAFPRSVEEIWREEQQFAPRFEVERRLALHYPSAMYYFVRRGNERLARALERGLQRLLDTGEFQRFFQVHHGQLLERAGMDKRLQLQLRNPLLPAATPLHDTRLWWRPGSA